MGSSEQSEKDKEDCIKDYCASLTLLRFTLEAPSSSHVCRLYLQSPFFLHRSARWHQTWIPPSPPSIFLYRVLSPGSLAAPVMMDGGVGKYSSTSEIRAIENRNNHIIIDWKVLFFFGWWNRETNKEKLEPRRIIVHRSESDLLALNSQWEKVEGSPSMQGKC